VPGYFHPPLAGAGSLILPNTSQTHDNELLMNGIAQV